MYKKSQASYFVLFALIIFIGAGFVFYVYSQNKVKESEFEKLEKLTLDIKPINKFIESCVQNVGKDAILFISEHGGYYDLPHNHYNEFGLSIPYYFYETSPFSPTKEQIQKQISKYMDENLFFCFRNFADFRKFLNSQSFRH